MSIKDAIAAAAKKREEKHRRMIEKAREINKQQQEVIKRFFVAEWDAEVVTFLDSPTTVPFTASAYHMLLDEKIPLQIWFGDVHDSSSYKFQYYRTPFNSLADLARLLEYDPQDLLCEAEERLRYKLHVEASCCYEDDRDG